MTVFRLMMLLFQMELFVQSLDGITSLKYDGLALFSPGDHGSLSVNGSWLVTSHHSSVFFF